MNRYTRMIESAKLHLIWCESQIENGIVELFDERAYPFIATKKQLDELHGEDYGYEDGVYLVKHDCAIVPYDRTQCARYLIGFEEFSNV